MSDGLGIGRTRTTPDGEAFRQALGAVVGEHVDEGPLPPDEAIAMMAGLLGQLVEILNPGGSVRPVEADLSLVVCNYAEGRRSVRESHLGATAQQPQGSA